MSTTTLQSVLTLPFQNIRNYVSVTLKEDGSNYLIWKNQFQSILLCSDLYEFVDGTKTKPDEFIVSGDSVILNQDFVTWRKLNSFVISCMLATLDDGVLWFVLGISTASEIWTCLEDDFLQRTKSMKSLLKKRLHQIQQGTSSISMYFNEIKSITDSLVAIGEKFDESDIVMIVLLGLGRDYRDFVLSVLHRVDDFTLDQCKSHLLVHEQWLKSSTLDSNTVSSKNVAYTRSTDSVYLSSNLENRRRLSKTDFSMICCQICKNFGHTANRCLFRYVPSKSSKSTKKNVQSEVSAELKQVFPKKNSVHIRPKSNVESSWLADEISQGYTKTRLKHDLFSPASSGGCDGEIVDVPKTVGAKLLLHQVCTAIQEDSVEMFSEFDISDKSINISPLPKNCESIGDDTSEDSSSVGDVSITGKMDSIGTGALVTPGKQTSACDCNLITASSTWPTLSNDCMDYSNNGAAFFISAIITSSCMVHTLVAGANDLLWIVKVLRKMKANSGHDTVVSNKLTSEGATQSPPTPSVPPDSSASATTIAPDVGSILVVTKSKAHYASQLSSQGLQGFSDCSAVRLVVCGTSLITQASIAVQDYQLEGGCEN